MILGQTFPYWRVRSQFSVADFWGASVAHHDLIRGSLQHGAVDAVHVFVDRGERARARAMPGLEELRAEFGDARVAMVGATDFASACRRDRYVFPAALGELEGLFGAREAEGRHRFPITLITHTVPNPHLFYSCYLEALLFGREHDALVVSSRAGRRAIEAILEGIREQLAPLGDGDGLGLNPGRLPIVDIPLGVDDQFLAPRDRAASRRLLGLPPDAFLLLFVGRLTERFKADLEPLLAAFAAIARAHPAARLVIAGREDHDRYADTIRRLAQAFDLTGRLHLLTNFPHYLKPAIYAASDLFVSPVDNVQETFGLALLEAMACGLPVIASDWSGYRDLVIPGETGWLVPTCWREAAGEETAPILPIVSGGVEHILAQQTVVSIDALQAAMSQAVAHPGAARRMGDAGRERVAAHFTWRTVTAAYDNLWRRQWDALRAHHRSAASRGAARRRTHGRSKGNIAYPPDLNHLYEPLATIASAVDGDVRCAPPAEENSLPLSCPGGIDAGVVRRLLRDVKAGERAVARIATTARRRDALIWLLKQGYLELV